MTSEKIKTYDYEINDFITCVLYSLAVGFLSTPGCAVSASRKPKTKEKSVCCDEQYDYEKVTYIDILQRQVQQQIGPYDLFVFNMAAFRCLNSINTPVKIINLKYIRTCLLMVCMVSAL